MVDQTILWFAMFGQRMNFVDELNCSCLCAVDMLLYGDVLGKTAQRISPNQELPPSFSDDFVLKVIQH